MARDYLNICLLYQNKYLLDQLQELNRRVDNVLVEDLEKSF